jgi:hypothetical protein
MILAIFKELERRKDARQNADSEGCILPLFGVFCAQVGATTLLRQMPPPKPVMLPFFQ